MLARGLFEKKYAKKELQRNSNIWNKKLALVASKNQSARNSKRTYIQDLNKTMASWSDFLVKLPIFKDYFWPETFKAFKKFPLSKNSNAVVCESLFFPNWKLRNWTLQILESRKKKARKKGICSLDIFNLRHCNLKLRTRQFQLNPTKPYQTKQNIMWLQFINHRLSLTFGNEFWLT